MSVAPVVCFGEVLWDCLPRGLFLGGAPMNVACHLQQLGRSAAMITAVGDDFLGREAVRRMQRFGVATEHVASLRDRQTGIVQVHLDAGGQPEYEIVADVAWDFIPLSDAALDAVRQAPAVVFGSLAQRSADNRAVLDAMLDAATGLKAFDVNLRPTFSDFARLWALAAKADLLKLNGDEARQLTDEAKAPLDAVARVLRERCGAERICITDGERGAGMLDGDQWHWAEGVQIEVADTVGAGDAFMAALIDGLLHQARIDTVLHRACRLAAYVASQDGAVPDLSDAPSVADDL